METYAIIFLYKNKQKFFQIKENIYVKLHITEESIQNFASIYNINIENKGHYNMPFSTINLPMSQTPLSMNRDIFQRRGYLKVEITKNLNTFFRRATNTERIMIIYGMLSEARFGENEDDNKYGINKLIRIGAAKDSYPLHDGPYLFNEEEDIMDLNDRQVKNNQILQKKIQFYLDFAKILGKLFSLV